MPAKLKKKNELNLPFLKASAVAIIIKQVKKIFLAYAI